VDKDATKIAVLQRGETPIFEPGLDDLIASDAQRTGPAAPRAVSLAALLSDEPRVATVRVIEDLETYSLGKKDFREAVALSVGFKDQIRQTYFDRYSALRSR